MIFFIFLLTAWSLEWFVFEETAKIGKEVRQKGFFNSSLLGFMFLCAVLFSALIGNMIGESTHFVKVLGLLFLTLGLFLRYWTYHITKPHFTRTLMLIDDRPLYSDGPFRFTRHPFHTGFFLNTLGICLFLSGHWLSILFTFIFVGSALHYRMTLEETLYSEKYGDIYIYWCRHRFRLLPFVY